MFLGRSCQCSKLLAKNRLPSKRIEKTPYELWCSKILDVSHIHVFGCKAFAHIPDERRRKLDVKGNELIFVGYSEESKAFRLLNKETNGVVTSRDVIFTDQLAKGHSFKNNEEIVISSNEELPEEMKPESTTVQRDVTESKENDQVNRESEKDKNLRCSARTNKGVPPDRYMANVVTVLEEPKDRSQAASGPDKEKWIKAMDEEISSLATNETWELVERPADRDVINCKWIFKIKETTEESHKYKAR